jgi:polar amino acid transport system permease protein
VGGPPRNGERRAARERAKKARARRGQSVAVVSSVLVLGGLATLIFTSSGWPDVRETFFSAEAFRTSFPEILDAFWLNIRMFLAVEAVVLVLGLVIALIRTSRLPALFPLRMLAAVYCDLFRGVPIILLIYLFGFGIPTLGTTGLLAEPIFLACLALSLAYGAYVAEVYRAGISSVHRTQTDAALAVGLTPLQGLRHVVLPQAIRRVSPPLLNDFISLQKDVALVSVLGVLEALRVAQIDTAATFNYTPLVAVAILYLAVTVPLARILDHYTKKGEVT